MRKFVVALAVMVMIVSSSVIAMAEEPDNDGSLIYSTVGSAYVNLPDINRQVGHFDTNPEWDKLNPAETQEVEKTILVKAWIPCYIGMEVTGNEGFNRLESFGPDAVTEDDFPVNLWFENEVGGFVDENWDPIGAGMNLEIVPGPNRFIFACDQLLVDVFANDEYIYEVEAAPLEPVDAPVGGGFADEDLDLYMRSDYLRSGTWSGWSADCIFDGSADPDIEDIVGTYLEACEPLRVKHEFKVPYFMTTAHGKYEGNIYLRAYIL